MARAADRLARANAPQFSHLGERLSLSRGRPNMRLKLAGALVLREVIVSCPSGHGRSFTSLAPAGGSPAAFNRDPLGGSTLRDLLCHLGPILNPKPSSAVYRPYRSM